MRKGAVDGICDGKVMLECSGAGSKRRAGGQARPVKIICPNPTHQDPNPTKWLADAWEVHGSPAALRCQEVHILTCIDVPCTVGAYGSYLLKCRLVPIRRMQTLSLMHFTSCSCRLCRWLESVQRLLGCMKSSTGAAAEPFICTHTPDACTAISCRL